MSGSPAVSVVVPCYNGGEFLDGLLASLAAQTFRDFEIIIVDDGSTDPATLTKLQALAGEARVIHQENRYLPGARNSGFRVARGTFVLPLDCDDRLDPAYLSDVVTAARTSASDVGFVFTHMRLAGGASGNLATRCNRFEQLFLNHLPYCLLVRKAAWEAVGGYDESMRDGMEDWEFNIRLLAAGYRGTAIANPYFVYTVRRDGMLLSKSVRRHATIWRAIRRKHADLYTPASLFAIWRANRPAWRSTARAVVLYTAVKVLPNGLCNALFFRANLLQRRLVGNRGRV